MKFRHQDNVRKRFFAPVMKAIREAKSYRYCVEYSDENFIIAGVGRVLASASSGRDWVQQICARMGFFVSVSSFFQALKSRRRLTLAKEVAGHIRKQVDSDCDASFDPLAQHPATGEVFSFITTQLTFPPGLIAFLYKLRWDIEKVFD